MPGAHLCNRGGKMGDCVVGARHRSVAARSMRYQTHSTRDFFGCGHSHVLKLAACLVYLAAFVYCILALDRVPVLFNHEVDSDAAGSFFARFSQKNNVAIE